MSIGFWRPGRRLFSTAAVLMILAAAIHAMVMLTSGPETPEEHKLFDHMGAFHIPIGLGMNPSFLDIYMALSFTWCITLAALGFTNLAVAAGSGASDSVVRRLGWLNAVWVAVYLLVVWSYKIAPPLITFAVIEIFVVASLIAMHRRPRASA